MDRATEPLLRVVALRKTFGGLHALEDINLEVWPGEVVGLVGDIMREFAVVIVVPSIRGHGIVIS